MEQGASKWKDTYFSLLPSYLLTSEAKNGLNIRLQTENGCPLCRRLPL